MILDELYLKLRFSVHYLWWGAREALSVLQRVSVWRE